ncbi:hypothetical protein SAMN02745121_06932 [Nannocystis exedens]|uniref:SMI1 / KNR4 family (SUKH-1) n=1 Tax=Nannocystis exedens TaxID=54 RepID=A0A1I2G160_9BACT|nr:hypothetical protein [Nannocystis exedens]PCC74566.1 hypothetical protein NAEX_07663 [Nannocystis exedens]SFF10381.1 hypothetical protein SAMN02745121_06932 [Nannocystis exedens]
MERRYLADYDALGLPPDEALRRVIARADADPRFSDDLERLMFELAPMPADQLDCHAPKFFVVAMDGGGSAYGRYVDAALLRTIGMPWVLWDHEEDALVYLADDTAAFLSGLLDLRCHDKPDDPSARRVRAVLTELGLQLAAPGSMMPGFLAGKPAAWLPAGPLSH